jgi:hypothetical protein
MSTVHLKEAVEMLKRLGHEIGHDGAVNLALAAQDELASIKLAARDLTRLHLGDYTDDVRRGAKVLADTPNGGNTWEHPDVKAWSDAAQVLEQIAKESA